ncbi:MAG: hypothetical protein JNM94_09250 [Phycisphaerae bacterium]|nr:hypothetical protein [Phycisphaerae bacterium]
MSDPVAYPVRAGLGSTQEKQQMARFILASAAAAMTMATVAQAQSYLTTGPSSSATPYIVPFPGSTAITDLVSILTVGDSIDGYQMLGIPDGMGAFLAKDGTMQLFVNHELTATASGVQHAHQPRGFAGGSFIAHWNVNIEAGVDFLSVNSGNDAILESQAVTNGSGGSLFNFARFCSGDIADPIAYFDSVSGAGTTHRFYTCGEESGAAGRMMATDLVTGISYQMTSLDPVLGAWENGVSRPFESAQTVMVATSDGNANRVFVYVGTKQTDGNPAERAGLLNGAAYGIQVNVDGLPVSNETREFGFGSSSLVLSAPFTLAPAGQAAGTTFLRPEDGAWDPANPADFYFVTTDRMSTTSGGTPQTHASRLWRLRFTDVNDVLAGGTIEALLDGTDVMEMGDNLCVFNDLQGGTRVLIQEDPGNHPHSAKTLLYTVANDSLEVIAQSDPARFGDIGLAPTAPYNQDEENSGIIDARETLGLGWFIADMQAHYSLGNPLVEGGQLYAFFAPEAVGSSRSDLSRPLDGIVDGSDLGILLGGWGSAGVSDINRDGTTDGADLGILLGNWNAN